MSHDRISAPPRAVTRRIAGWGNFPVEECHVYRPERLDQLLEVVTAADQSSIVARGLGRSYGDASLNRDAGVVSSECLDRLIAFDPASGVLDCEAGVSLAEIIDHFLPRGFFFPLTPGTKCITLGGAIAADVHGKNHHRDGSIASLLLDFRLLTARGEILLCSREQNPDLFWATLGGMGLTGIILDARIVLRAVETGYLAVDYEKAPNLDAILERMVANEDGYAYSVAWIDCMAKGRSLGRSVLMQANHAGVEEIAPPLRTHPWKPRTRRPIAVPFTLPNFTLNRLSLRAFNSAFYLAHRNRHVIADCNSWFYMLDSMLQWNRVYGRRGMLQYQVVIPPESTREALVELLEDLSRSRNASFLAVLKTFGPKSGGLLSFPTRGHTLALDLPNTGGAVLDAVARLDRIVLRHGGRVYLAKDCCMHPETFRAMYPGLERFREIKSKVDPNQRFSSSLARRLGIVDPG